MHDVPRIAIQLVAPITAGTNGNTGRSFLMIGALRQLDADQ
jgi:hypothetical protein